MRSTKLIFTVLYLGFCAAGFRCTVNQGVAQERLSDKQSLGVVDQELHSFLLDESSFELPSVIMPTPEEKELSLLGKVLSDDDVEFIPIDTGIGGLSSGSSLDWPYAPMASMSDVAELFPPHEGVTKLFLNFDGHDGKYVSSFVATADSRERDIQEIMFAVAQTFAPFNVQVRRFHGNSQMAESNGHTTIFIGDKLGNTMYYESDTGILVDNNKRAYADGDYPCPARGVTHQPNSDTYNLGFVDPISALSIDGYQVDWDTNSNAQIARAICHEAGHTFGLAHVLSGSNPDIMSYSTSNMRAIYQEFPLTSLNSQINGPTVESWDLKPMWWFFQFTGFGKTQLAQAPLETQNSYRVLSATLGNRDTNQDYANVANSTLVSGAYVDATSTSIDKWQMIPSQIESYGDYDVFDLTPETTEYLQVRANAMEGDTWFNPVVMVFNSSGTNLLAYDNDSGTGKASKLVFHAVLGQSYKVVVGSLDNNTHGTYQLSVEAPVFQINPAVGNPVGGLKGSSIDQGILEIGNQLDGKALQTKTISK